MSDSRIAGRPAADGHDPAYEIARELVGMLPFGARDDTVARCTRLTDSIASTTARSPSTRSVRRVHRATVSSRAPNGSIPTSSRAIS